MCWDKMCVLKWKVRLGFRHIYDFNIALLGKQGWHLMCNSESLVARVYKAMYYPRSSFLAVNMDSNPSFIWKSLMVAQDLLK